MTMFSAWKIQENSFKENCFIQLKLKKTLFWAYFGSLWLGNFKTELFLKQSFKFFLRLYVVVTSCKNIREIHQFDLPQNLEQEFFQKMHLTFKLDETLILCKIT